MATISSTPATGLSGTLAVASWWAKDPIDPTRNINIYPETPFKTSKEEVQAVHKPLGRTREVVTADKVLGEHVKLDNVTFTTGVAAAAFETLRDSQRVLLLQSPIKQWYGRFAARRDRVYPPTPDMSWSQAGIEFIETDAI